MPTRYERQSAAKALRSMVDREGVGLPNIGVEVFGIHHSTERGKGLSKTLEMLADLIEPGSERSYDEGYDDGYRAGLQSAYERLYQDGGRGIPVAEVKVDRDILKEMVDKAVEEIMESGRKDSQPGCAGALFDPYLGEFCTLGRKDER